MKNEKELSENTEEREERVKIPPLVWGMCIVTAVVGGYVYWQGFQAIERLGENLPALRRIDNNQKNAIQMLKEDVSHLTGNSKMVAMSPSACEWLWGAVAEELEEAVQRGTEIKFIVGPEFDVSDSVTLAKLSKEYGSVELYSLRVKPEVDIRLIDEKRLYVAHHGVKDGYPRDCWHSEPNGLSPRALKDAKAFIKRYENVAKKWFEIAESAP